MRLITLLAGLWLAGCTALPAQFHGEREKMAAFALEARFALRHTPANGNAQSSGGRLSWQHSEQSERLLLANPLGIGIAEIDARPGLANLTTSDGKSWTASSPDALLEHVTGQALPISRLPAWLLGRHGDGEMTRDPLGRPLRLQEAGWRVDYSYDSDEPNALPARLTLSDGAGLELRLRIEAWRPLP